MDPHVYITLPICQIERCWKVRGEYHLEDKVLIKKTRGGDLKTCKVGRVIRVLTLWMLEFLKRVSGEKHLSKHRGGRFV